MHHEPLCCVCYWRLQSSGEKLNTKTHPELIQWHQSSPVVSKWCSWWRDGARLCQFVPLCEHWGCAGWAGTREPPFSSSCPGPAGEYNGNNSVWTEPEGIRLHLAPYQQLLSVIGTLLWNFHGVGTTEPAGAEICGICYLFLTKELQSK